MLKIAAWVVGIAAGATTVFAFVTGTTSLCLFCDEDREAYNTAKKCGTITCYEKYLTFFPNGNYRTPVTRAVLKLQMLQDESDWKAALRCGTIKCYNVYINSNKNGYHLNEARHEISVLKRNRKNQLEADRLEKARQREIEKDRLEDARLEADRRRKLEEARRRELEEARLEEARRHKLEEARLEAVARRQEAHDLVRIVGQYVQFKKVTNGVITGGRSANATAAFILENLSGRGFDAAIKKGSVFIGSCISSTWMSVSGLSSYNDAKIFDRLKTFVPAYAKVRVVLNERCPMENLSSVDVGATITISQGGRMYSLALSAPNVPVRH